jgi:thiol-disulfide isomerase/thioredoxin
MTHVFNRTVAGVAFLAAVALLSTQPLTAQTPPKTPPKAPPSAQAVLDAALKTAKASNKGVFIHFSASWCTWCHKLQAFVESPVGKATFGTFFVSDELIVQEIGDKKPLENPGGSALLTKWGGTEDTPLPYYVFLDATGKKIADSNAMPDGSSVGYPSTPDAKKAFDALLIKVAPKMSADTRTKILDYMSTHK